MNIRKEAVVPEGYRCPFCLDHEDETFYDSTLVGQPLCDVCTFELSHFAEQKTQPNDFLIDTLLSRTGLTWAECRRAILQEELNAWIQVAQEKPKKWLASIQQELDWSEAMAWQYVSNEIQRLQTLLAESQASNGEAA